MEEYFLTKSNIGTHASLFSFASTITKGQLLDLQIETFYMFLPLLRCWPLEESLLLDGSCVEP